MKNNNSFSIMAQLSLLWQQVPEWRLGQFISNLSQYIDSHYQKDIFYVEDDELIKFAKEYLEKLGRK